MYWLYWLFILILLAAASGAGVLAYRTYVMGDTSRPNLNIGGWLFRQRPEPRLGVIEQASVDARRRLVLIRRDGVEHLIMTGGPVDVVIETGIQAPHPEPTTRGGTEPSPPVFTRQPRNLGQAVNE
jgi:flagellar protein FliO/FliZ